MVVAWAIPIGVLAGLLAGGRLDGLTGLRIRWAWLAIGGLLVQVVLFGLPSSDTLEAVGPIVYVTSTAVVLLALVVNLRVPGLWIVGLGAASNLAAIVANGGYMPTTAEALAAAGVEEAEGFSNSVVLADPALAPLTDILALPSWIPLANVFSVGDVLIALGIAASIILAMRAGRSEPSPLAGPAAAP